MSNEKTVEEIVEEMFDTEYMTDKQPNLNKDWLRTTLTATLQQIFQEGVEAGKRLEREHVEQQFRQLKYPDQKGETVTRDDYYGHIGTL
jgi:hypothetical protein